LAFFRDKKIHLTQMVILSLFIFITAVAMKPIISETDRRMNIIKDSFMESLERTINYEISYSSISPSIFSYISIKDLIIYKDKANNDILAEIKSFKAFYSPFYFLKSNSLIRPLQAVKRFNINNARININQKREEQFLSLFAPQEKNSNVSLLPLETIFTGKNIELTVETDLGVVKADDLFFTLTPEDQSYKTRIDGELNINLIDQNFMVNNIFSKVSIRGTIAEYFDSLNFTVKTIGLTSNVIDLKDQTFQLISSSEELLVRKVQDNSPIDLSLRFDRTLNDIIITFNAEEFKPDSLVELKGELISFAPYASSEITGNGSLLIHNENSTIYYSVDSQMKINRDVFDRDILVKADFAGDKKQINVKSLDVKTREGRILFTGDIITDSFFPSGLLTLRNIQSPMGYEINTELAIQRDSGFLYLNTNFIDIGQSDIRNFELLLYPDNKILTGSLQGEIIDSRGKAGYFTADSLLDFSGKPELSSSIALTELPFEKIISFLPENITNISIPDDLNDFVLSSEIFLTTDFEDIDAQVNNFQLLSSGETENRLTFSASYSRTGFNINDLYFKWDEYVLNGYVNSNIEDDEYLVSTQFDFQDKPYRLQAIYNGEEFLFEGDYGLYGFYQKNKKGADTFRLTSTEFPVPVMGQSLYADLDLNGYLDKSDWKIYLNNTSLSADNLYLLNNPEIALTAEIDRYGCNFYDIRFEDGTSSLKGLGRLTYDTGDISSWISLLDESGRTREQYDLFFSMEDKDIESRLSIVSSPLNRFSESGLDGFLSADLAYTGTRENPDFTGVLNTDQMMYNGVSVDISSYIRGDKDVVRISDLELNYNDIMVNRGLILLELNKGKLLATAGISQNLSRSKASTAITARITADNSYDIFTLNKLNTSQLDGKITIAPILWNEFTTFPQLNIDLKKDQTIFSATIEDGDILDAEYDMEKGDIKVAIKDLFPLRFSAVGNIRDSLIDISLKNFYFDPQFINYFMPTDPFKDKKHVVFKSGSINGDLNISGKLSDPDFNGILTIDELEVESPYIAENPEPASTIAYFEGHKINLDPLIIKLKNGTIKADSSFEFDGAIPRIFDVDVSITGSSGVRIAYEIPKFSWDGHFTGYAHLEGNKNGGFLRGDLLCNDLITSLQSDAEKRTVKKIKKNPSVNGFIVDLTIQTGRDVNFYLPNQQVPIIQATAANGDILNIGYDSKTENLDLVGKIDIRTGEINYFSKTFYLQEGYIDFNESQVKFNPLLNVRADIITKDELGDDVTISLSFNDYLMNEFEPEIYSFPGKSENEILALLGQSFIPSNDPDKVSVASLIVATGGMIGKNTIMQPFEEAIKSSFQLDFVSFNTDIIENAILDRFQEQDVNNLGNQGMNFAKYLENTSLFVGEYIGDFLFVEGSLVVDYDESNSVSSTMGGLELLVNLNLQFITPFVLIDWTYNPKNNPGSDYFFPQNTITFTWRYSY